MNSKARLKMIVFRYGLNDKISKTEQSRHMRWLYKRVKSLERKEVFHKAMIEDLWAMIKK